MTTRLTKFTMQIPVDENTETLTIPIRMSHLSVLRSGWIRVYSVEILHSSDHNMEYGVCVTGQIGGLGL